MAAYIIDGRKLAREREKLLQEKVSQFVKKTGRKPRLVAVKLSDDEGSRRYLKLKKAAAERVGIQIEVCDTSKLSASDVQAWKYRKLPKFDADGVFVQHPPGISTSEWFQIVDQIPPEKDVDCLTTANLLLIKEGRLRFLPATVKAVGYCLLEALEVLEASGTSGTFDTFDTLRSFLLGKSVGVLGRSMIVGQPLAWWLESLGAEVQVGHSKTPFKELCRLTEKADILISAVGKPGLVTGEMVKKGAVVIDVGSPKGDMRFDGLVAKVAAITPVPGGVGPLTVVSLLENVVAAAVVK